MKVIRKIIRNLGPGPIRVTGTFRTSGGRATFSIKPPFFKRVQISRRVY